MHRIAPFSVAILVTAVTLAGCSTPRRPALQTPPSAPPSSDPSATERQAVIAAYEGMWTDYEKDVTTANWQNPTSAHHATGDALVALETTLAVNGHHGWIGKGKVDLHPVIKSLTMSGTASTAEVVDCADLTHALLYVAATGALKDDTPGGWHLIDATLVTKDGGWKVSTFATGAVGSC